MKHLSDNLLAQFSLASFVVLLTIALTLAYVLSSRIKSDAINDLVDEAVGASSGRLLSAITPADLEVPMTGERYDRFHKFVQQSVVSDRTARVKLWARDGTVIYSNDPAGVGEKFPTKENLLKALSGENAIEIKIPKDAENARERTLGTLMEVYTPIIFPGNPQPAGSFEIYQYYEPTAQRIEALNLWIFGSLGVGFLLLYAGLVTIVWRGWNTITKQRHELQDANAALEERIRESRESNEQLLAGNVERQQLQEQLQQSQKMEAIGLLAGGVAHDFNNLLTPIMGYAQMEIEKLPRGDSSISSLEQIQKAAERAANLTRQLLAFSRRQAVEPKVINLNDLIIDLDQMLRRLLGEDIELVTLPSATLDLVEADPGQIEQVVMNLAVNARDAMPNGGKLTIETANIALEQPDPLQHKDAPSGPHVLLSVADAGSGMTKEVQARIFEPFFTTKEEGKGTGLGLATCFGIARQNGGHIEVQSELGQGTTFKLYLPRTESAIQVREGSGESETPRVSLRGTETVLLAEDEPLVRKLLARVLRDQGYRVMEAATGQEALEIFQSQEPGSIQMLLTDVVMPQMGGIELAQRITNIQPNTKVLFASGYTQGPLFLSGDPSQEIRFIQKPFLTDALASKVREVLDWEPARAEV